MSARIVRGLSKAEYDEAPGVRASELIAAHKSGRHWRQYCEGSRKETPAMWIGTLVHLAVLEPDEWARYVPAWTPPKVDRRTVEGKAAAERFAVELAAREAACAKAGQIMIDAEEIETVNACANAVLEYEAVPGVTLRKWLASADRELSIFWTNAAGIECKARLDAYSGGVILDVKTTRDASGRKFAYSVSDYGYHVQAAHYSDAAEAAGLTVSGFVFAAVEAAPPTIAAMWRLPPAVMARGARDAAAAFETIAAAKAGRLSGYTTGIETLSIPWLED